jgi:hypothetical protein
MASPQQSQAAVVVSFEEAAQDRGGKSNTWSGRDTEQLVSAKRVVDIIAGVAVGGLLPSPSPAARGSVTSAASSVDSHRPSGMVRSVSLPAVSSNGDLDVARRLDEFAEEHRRRTQRPSVLGLFDELPDDEGESFGGLPPVDETGREDRTSADTVVAGGRDAPEGAKPQAEVKQAAPSAVGPALPPRPAGYGLSARAVPAPAPIPESAPAETADAEDDEEETTPRREEQDEGETGGAPVRASEDSTEPENDTETGGARGSTMTGGTGDETDTDPGPPTAPPPDVGDITDTDVDFTDVEATDNEERVSRRARTAAAAAAASRAHQLQQQQHQVAAAAASASAQEAAVASLTESSGSSSGSEDSDLGDLYETKDLAGAAKQPPLNSAVAQQLMQDVQEAVHLLLPAAAPRNAPPRAMPSWSERVAIMSRLSSALDGRNVASISGWWSQASATGPLRLWEMLALQIADLRSAVVKEACNLCSVLAKALGHCPEFADVIVILLPPLVKRLPVSVKVRCVALPRARGVR